MMLSLRFKMMKKRMTSNLSSEMILLHPSQMLLYYLTRKKDDILSKETKSILHVELLPQPSSLNSCWLGSESQMVKVCLKRSRLNIDNLTFTELKSFVTNFNVIKHSFIQNSLIISSNLIYCFRTTCLK